MQSLSVLESATFADRHKRRLQKLILPKRVEILELIRLLRHLHAGVHARAGKYVFCHGDVWGGNLIIDPNDNLIFLDWEECLLAPPERDLFGYIGEGFESFFFHYRERAGRPVPICADLLRFYAYRHHLRNLTHWIQNILYRNTDEEQNANDLEMIEFHCMNRWGDIEANIRKAGF